MKKSGAIMKNNSGNSASSFWRGNKNGEKNIFGATLADNQQVKWVTVLPEGKQDENQYVKY